MKRALALLLTTGALLVAAPAIAQPTSEREAQAEDLFQRGKERMAAHDLAKACALFDESYRLDSAGGTLQNLAVCYEDLGKWASAYARFEELRAVSKAATPPRQDRIALAEAHITTLRAKVSRLFVVVPPASRVPGLTVKIDGTVYGGVSLSEGVLVDPGSHAVEVSAPERVPFVTRVEVEGREKAARAEVMVPPLAAATHEVAGPGARAPQHASRPAGLVVGGLGLVALGAGGVFGLLAIRANDSGKDRCQRSSNAGAPASDFDPVTGHCLEGSSALDDANADKSRASDLANVANVLVPVGAVALAVGAYLFFRETPSSSSSASARARVVPGLGAARFEVHF